MGGFCSSDAASDFLPVDDDDLLIEAADFERKGVPSLFELCINDLADHLADLDAGDLKYVTLVPPSPNLEAVLPLEFGPPELVLGPSAHDSKGPGAQGSLLQRSRSATFSSTQVAKEQQQHLQRRRSRGGSVGTPSMTGSFLGRKEKGPPPAVMLLRQLHSSSVRLPDALVERLLHVMVESQRLHVYNLSVFSSAQYRRLSLAHYPGVTDSWIHILLRAHTLEPPQTAAATSSLLPGCLPSNTASESREPILRDRCAVEEEKSESWRDDPYCSTTASAPPTQTETETKSLSSALSPLYNESVDNDATDMRLRMVADVSPFPLTLPSSTGLVEFDATMCLHVTGRGLAPLRFCVDIEVLRLRGCVNVTDESLSCIKDMKRLRVLDVGRCQGVTDKTLSHLADKWRMEELSLESCVNVSDQGIAQLQNLRMLASLNVGWCHRVSIQGLRSLGHMSDLVALNIAHTDAGSSSSFRSLLSTMPRLAHINLSGSRISDRGFRCLSVLTDLRSIDLQRSACRDLSFLPSNLETLRLGYTKVAAPQLSAHLLRCPSLTVLDLEACQVTDQVLAAIAQLTELRELNIADTDVSNRGMRSLSTLTSLETLNCSMSSIGNSGLRLLRSLGKLKHLHMDCPDVSDAGLVHLSSLESLNSLEMFSTDVSDLGMQYISHLDSLTNLEICSGRISNDGLQSLSQLTALQRLSLAQNRRIDDKGVVTLSCLRRLKHLNLSRTSVTHKGLAFIRALPRMQSLSLYGCEKLKPQSPKLDALSAQVHLGLESQELTSIPLFEHKVSS